MEEKECRAVAQVVFERLISGEDRDQLRAQLVGQMADEEANQLLAQALARIEEGRGRKAFEREAESIRKRRLVGNRYLPWKILASLGFGAAALSVIGRLTHGGVPTGSFAGLLTGGIILTAIELRKRRLMGDLPEPADETPKDGT